MHILLVEDDDCIAKTLADVLNEQHYIVDVAKDGELGWELAKAFTYDLLLLDVVLPKLDGINLCRRLRGENYKMPILLLTSKNSSADKVTGLNAGADDYVVKPFDLEELLARIRVLLRRGSAPLPPVLEWENLRLDPNTREVSYAGHPLHLTPKAYSLLELFLRNSSRVFSRSDILEHLWSIDESPDEQTITAHIKSLRQKLKTAGAKTDFIETVYGIGYRLKQPEEVTQTKSNRKSKVKAALAGVWERSKQQISDRFTVIEQATMALQENTRNQQLLEKAKHEAHILAGSLGIFDFFEGSRLAKEIESIFAAEGVLDQAQLEHLSQLVVALRLEIDKPPQLEPMIPQQPTSEYPLVLIVDTDAELTQQIVALAGDWKMRVHVAKNLSLAKQFIVREHPDVALLDLSFPDEAEDRFTILAALANRTPAIPVLVFTSRDSFTDRVEVARLGGRAFLQKPILPEQVLEAVSKVLQQGSAAQAKVMIVDDNPQQLAALEILLRPWGFQLIALNDPRRFWDTLETSAPDLLILDVDMPYVNGIELCQVVRNDNRWSELPVLFLTGHTDAETVHRIFAIGADDYVSKPMIGPELVTRIINRLERVRLLRSLADKDALTGVANRRKSMQDLTRLLRLAARHNQSLCLTVLDLDYFKQVNDSFGHTAGDQVLHRLGELLLRSFRGEDVVARWGGEEFILGMYSMTTSDALQRLKQLRSTWQQEEFTAPDGSKFGITFSAGIAQYPSDGKDVQELYRSADTALYRAKKAGRDRIMPAGAITDNNQI